MNRVALYLGHTPIRANRPDLGPYFQGARANGLRVVSVRQEDPGGAQGRPVLTHLIARMEAGEFEAIISVVDIEVTSLVLPKPTVHGNSWIARRSRTR